MPTISSFSGIIIIMFPKDHAPPHVHAVTQQFFAPFLISSGELMAGDFPIKGQKKVKEFILNNQKELEEMWETRCYRRLPPVR